MNKEHGWPAPEEDGMPFAPPGGSTAAHPSTVGQYTVNGYPVAQDSAGYSGPGGFGPQGPGPGGPGYGSGPGYGNYRPSTKGRGLAIAALCVAGFGLMFSWIWFLNFIAYLAGAVALGLGIPALRKGIKAQNIALPLSITALSSAVLSMIMATIINLTVQYGFPEAETGTNSIQSEAVPVPGPVPAVTPAPAPTQSQADEPEEQSGLPDRDYSADVSGTFFTDIIEQPAASAGESVQVGDYTVTLTEVDRDASAEVLQRDPSAGEPTHGYVLFEFRAVYNGSPAGNGTGRPDLDFTPKFIGADARLHSVLNCSMDLGPGSAGRLAPGETGTHEICFDLPEAALGEDSRVGLRMILAERDEDVWWRVQ